LILFAGDSCFAEAFMEAFAAFIAASIEAVEVVGASVDADLLEHRAIHNGLDRLFLADSRINDVDSSRNAITSAA